MATTNCVAIDCEMVGGMNDEILPARVSLVNVYGQVILDEYINPLRPIRDYRTQVSGITPSLVSSGKFLEEVRPLVAILITGRILVGHSLDVDLNVLRLDHPEAKRRDLAAYNRFKQMNNGQPASLKFLAEKFLGKRIQIGPHSSVEDAKAAMEIYRQVAHEW